MSIQKKRSKNVTSFVVRWREGDRHRSRAFATHADAKLFDTEVRRRQALGSLAMLEAGRETLDNYVTAMWAPSHMPTLAEKTRRHYANLYDVHLAPDLGGLALRDITAETLKRWQAQRLADAAGPVAVRHALDLLGSIMQLAFEAGRVQTNEVRRVRRAPRPPREEVRPLAPALVESMRQQVPQRDATLISVLAYAGLRPGEALALRWGDVEEATLRVRRAISLGKTKTTKTDYRRSVRLLAPLRQDLLEWRMATGRPSDTQLVFPGVDGQPWTEPAYQSWRRAACGSPRHKTGKPGRGSGPFARALQGAGIDHATPYTLRHSFASLLLYEGRSVIYVARQLGHAARLTLSTYGHIIEELEAATADAARLTAEQAIEQARAAAVPTVCPQSAQHGA
jgi:integrase